MPYIPSGIVVRPRDLEFLCLLLHTRILTLSHAAALIFNGSSEAAKKRIQKLKAAGFVLERRRKAYEPGILFLSKRGFECLRENGALPEECADITSFSKRATISELTLHHELEVLDVKVAFHEAANRTVNGNGTRVLEWTYVQSEVNGESFIPYAGAFLGGSNSAQKSMTVFLNSEGRVSDYTVSSGGTEYRENQLGTPGGSGN